MDLLKHTEKKKTEEIQDNATFETVFPGKKIKVCPRCLSTRLVPSSMFSGWLTSESFRCLDCGYTGTVFIEVDVSELEHLRRERKLIKEKDKQKKSEGHYSD